MPRKKLGELLIDAGLLGQGDLRIALGEQQRWGGQLGRVLIQLKMISEQVLVQTLSQQLNFPTIDLKNLTISQEVLALVPIELAQRHMLLPFGADEKFLDVAMGDPTDLGIIDELRIRTQRNIRWYLAGPKTIAEAIETNYHANTEPSISVSPYPAAATTVRSNPKIDLKNGEEPQMQDTATIGHTPPAIRQIRARSILETGSRADADLSDTTQVFDRTKERTAEVRALQQRVSELESYVRRDGKLLRGVLKVIVEKGLISREELLEKLQ